jgi:hypothetical protein
MQLVFGSIEQITSEDKMKLQITYIKHEIVKTIEIEKFARLQIKDECPEIKNGTDFFFAVPIIEDGIDKNKFNITGDSKNRYFSLIYDDEIKEINFIN